MPDFEIIKLEGTKLVPSGRFNLEPTSTPGVIMKSDFMVSNLKLTAIEMPFLSSLIVNLPAIEKFPLIEKSEFGIDDSFFEYQNPNVKWGFPKINIQPGDDCLFWYTNEIDANAAIVSQTGEIRLKHLAENGPGLNNIPIELVQVQGFFKVIENNEETWIPLDGKIQNNLLIIPLKDKMVKVAFNCLKSEGQFKLCLFFQFSGIKKVEVPLFHGVNLKPYLYQKANIEFSGNLIERNDFFINNKINRTENIDTSKIIDGQFNSMPNKIAELNTLYNIPINNTITPIEEHTMDTNPADPVNQKIYKKQRFLLPFEKIVYSSIAPFNTGSFRKFNKEGEIFTGINNELEAVNISNPYTQIFLTNEISNKANIYKFNYQPNQFIIVPKTYILARTNDSNEPCINFNFYFSEEGVSLEEDISRIEMNFAIGAGINEFEQKVLQKKIIEEGYSDNQVKNTDEIIISFPSNVAALFHISGNILFDTLSIVPDGNYFNCNLILNNLSAASLLINNMENRIPLHFCINFEYGLFKENIPVEIDLTKTGGNILTVEYINHNLVIKNTSSLCLSELKNLMIKGKNQDYISSQLFSGVNKIIPQTGQLEIAIKDLNALFELGDAKFFLDYTIIEDPALELAKNITTNSDYYLNLSVSIKKSNKKIKKALLFVQHTSTKANLKMEILKERSNFPTTLFRLFIPNKKQTNDDFVTSYFYGYDKEGNLIHESIPIVFNYKLSSKIEL